jgi:hypothetical protein
MSSERPSPALRQQVIDRAQGCCEYCFTQRRFSSDPFSIEHIVPRSRGGASEPGNLALSCQGCNNLKYSHFSGVDPVSGAEVPLYHPRADIWSEHFAWNSLYTEIMGLTARGRATVVRLRLNRPELVALRTILAAAGLHPPDYPTSRANP